jgi:hypothetical protein
LRQVNAGFLATGYHFNFMDDLLLLALILGVVVPIAFVLFAGLTLF